MMLVFFVIFSILSVVVYSMFTETNTEIQSDDDLGNISKNVTGSIHSNFPSMFDNAFASTLGLLWLFSLAAAYYSRGNKILLIIMIILIIVVLGLSMLVSNIYEEVADDSEYSNSVSNFPITDFIMGNLFVTLIAISFSVLMAMYFGGRDE